MDAHMEKQPPIKGQAWSPRVWEPGAVAQQGIPASGMAVAPAKLWSGLVAWPMSSHGAAPSKAAVDADIGMACAAPVKAGIW